MNARVVPDFEDLLQLFDLRGVRALIVGGMAFIYHAKPRYTKDMDLWLDSDPENIDAANLALRQFGSPDLLDPDDPDEVLQIGAAPNRIDLLRNLEGVDFEVAWRRKIRGEYGSAPANWIDLDSLIVIKSAIDHPRHREDARILRQVRDMRKKS